MNQPQARISADRDPDAIAGKGWLPVIKAVDVLVTGNNTDQVVLAVEPGTYVRCFARVKTALDGTSPTVDVGIATDPDALIANTALLAETVNDVAESVGGIFFAAAGNVTVDIGGSDTTEGEVERIFELFSFPTIMADPHGTKTIVAAA